MAGLWNRIRGNKGESLVGDLKKVTDCGVIDVPKELFKPVVEATLDADNRRQIMNYVRECLCDTNTKRWRRVHAAILLTEELMLKGDTSLVIEVAEGAHFDLVQRLSFLEVYDLPADRRAQGMVRSKAAALRKELVHRLETAPKEECSSLSDAAKDNQSTRSPGNLSSTTMSPRSTINSVSTGFGSEDVINDHSSIDFNRPKGKVVLNGVVTVGHSEDTSDEEDASSNDGGRRRNFRKPANASVAPSQASAAGGYTGGQPPPAAPSVDLLAL